MKIVASPTDVPSGKTTTRGFSYDGTKYTLATSPEIAIQNTPAPRISANSDDFALKRKMYGGDRNMFVVGTITAQPDRIGNRHFDDFTRDPKPPLEIPDLRLPSEKK